MISVIILIYNAERYLDKCLTSILENTYRNLEVICVNDGSTDGSPMILQRIKAQDPRVVVIDQENLDLERARNNGLDAATGDYIAFIDADDFVHPKYFELLLECMKTTDADMVVCGVRRFTENEEFSIEPKPELRYKKLTAEQLAASCFPRRVVWGRLMRSRDAQTLRFPPEVRWAQDSLYNLRLIGRLDDPAIYEIDAELYYYLQIPTSRFHRHAYESAIAIADWYVRHWRDPRHMKTGPWAWVLLYHAITTTLRTRYQASLLKNRKLVRKSNALLRPMVTDLVRDRYVRLKYKLGFAVIALFPWVYRRFRVWNDPTFKDSEKEFIKNVGETSKFP